MALETFLTKLKTAISSKPTSKTTRPSPPPISSAAGTAVIGVLSFEVARLLSKLLHLSLSLSDTNVVSLRDQTISLDGVRKMVPGDEMFLLSLACAELAESLGHAGKAVSRLSRRCTTASLRSFESLFYEFADMDRDPHGWVLNCKDMEAKNKKMERYVNVTTALYRAMEELTMVENTFKKYSTQLILGADKEHDNNKDLQKLMDLKNKIQWQRQQVKYLKDRSLWNKSFDAVVMILVRSVFTTLARLKSVFSTVSISFVGPTSLPRSLSSSSTLIHPSPNDAVHLRHNCETHKTTSSSWPSAFFAASSKLLKPPETTLGGSALALHYANLIVVMEKMIKQPQLVGLDARDDLYGMLPESVRTSLRSRLRGVGFTATDAGLAAEWKAASERILGWLLPLAHNMIRWQSERSFEQQNMVVAAKTNSHHRHNHQQVQIQANQQHHVSVMLLQTLFFADRARTEAAITELLVGLNYIWRFEREMTAKALFNLQSPN